MKQYPRVIAARQASAAGQDAVRLARLTYLPRLEIYGQLNRATDNNLGGLLFHNPLPVITGPVLASSSASFWGGTGGAAISWEPYTFGRRRAGVASARYAAMSDRQRLELARLRAGAGAAEAFLAVLSETQALTVSQSNVHRWRAVDRIVHALAKAQLRPAGDAARVDAELAAARVTAVEAEAARQEALWRLAERLGVPQARLALQAGELASSLPRSSAPPPPPKAQRHPAALVQRDRAAAAKAREREISRQAWPRILLLGAAEVRRAQGLASLGSLQIPAGNATNWAAGASVQFSISRWLRTRREKQIALAKARQQQAREREIRQRLEYANRNAQAAWQAVWQTARITPTELTAARTGEAEARARYQAGLTNIVDLMNAEEILSRAQSANALARLNVWQVLLRWNYLRGRLRPFLNALQSTYTGGKVP